MQENALEVCVAQVDLCQTRIGFQPTGEPESTFVVASTQRLRNRDSTPLPRRLRTNKDVQVIEIPDENIPPQVPPCSRAVRVARWWSYIEAPDEIQGIGGPATAPAIERQVLRCLNHPNVEVVKQVKHIGEKSACHILEYRQREGDLVRVGDLASKVGLKDSLVRQVLRDYGLAHT